MLGWFQNVDTTELLKQQVKIEIILMNCIYLNFRSGICQRISRSLKQLSKVSA